MLLSEKCSDSFNNYNSWQTLSRPVSITPANRSRTAQNLSASVYGEWRCRPGKRRRCDSREQRCTNHNRRCHERKRCRHNRQGGRDHSKCCRWRRGGGGRSRRSSRSGMRWCNDRVDHRLFPLRRKDYGSCNTTDGDCGHQLSTRKLCARLLVFLFTVRLGHSTPLCV